MSQSAPFADSNPPDWRELRAIFAEMRRLIERGEWSKAEFDRLYEQGRAATNGHDEFLECLINEADSSWLD